LCSGRGSVKMAFEYPILQSVKANQCIYRRLEHE
jgi:hypothetical protein